MATDASDLSADVSDDDVDGAGISPRFEREVSEELGDDDASPRAAVLLARFAGLAIVFDGIFLISSDTLIGTVGTDSLGFTPGFAGLLGIVLGLLVFFFAIAMVFDEDAHVAYGVAIILSSVLSLVGGGGFFLGTIFGVVAGVLAIRFEPEETPDEAPDVRSLPRGPIGTRRCSACGADLAAGDRRCPRCGNPQSGR